MKINLSEIDQDNFIVREGRIAGETCYLVFPPHIGTKWNRDNLHFRSSIWNSEGSLISASYKKFFNWGEQPDLTYTPFSTKANGGINVRTKEDGSTLIVSKYKGQLITRTRGTFCTSSLDCGDEINYLIEKYPKAFELKTDNNGTANYSLIYEWVTPNNIIVINYGDEPDIILTNKVNHEDYSLTTQLDLDLLAKEIGVKRPDEHHYDSIKELLSDVETWEGKEGVVVYCKYDQEMRKVKASQYLALHRMKSELGSFNRVLDVFLEMGCPNYNDFYSQLVEIYDYEIAQQAIPHISILCDAWREVQGIEEGMKKFVARISKLDTRKEQALEILSSYGKGGNRSGMVFKLLDGNPLEQDDYKKLILQLSKIKE